jgi:prevent-host-death family protein
MIGHMTRLFVIIRVMKTRAKVMNASDFKAKCLRVLDELEPAGVLIMKRGKPVARVVPVSDKNALQLVGSLKGKVKINGDILSTGTKWNAQS